MSWQDGDISMRTLSSNSAEVKLDPTARTHKRAFNNENNEN